MNSHFLEALKKLGVDSEELLAKIEENNGSIQKLDEIPHKLKEVFVVAGDIVPEDHIRMQAAFQKYTDNGISKTINFPNNATVEDVRRAYWLTYETGCRMITIYRDGSRIKQVLETKKGRSYYDQLTGKRLTTENDQPAVPRKKPTPQEAWGMRVRKKADVGYVYTSVFRDGQGEPVEVFVTIGKTGGYVSGAAEVTGRLASRALKYGASLEEIASDLIGISCGTPYGIGPDSVLSAFDAVGKSLMEISRSKQLQLPEISDQTAETIVKTQPKVPVNNNSNGALTNGQTNGQTNLPSQTNGQTIQMPLNNSLAGTASGSINNLNQPQNDTSVSPSMHKTNKINIQNFTSPISGPASSPVSFEDEKIIESKFAICPDCSSPVVYLEGCRQCINPTCGWSKCS